MRTMLTATLDPLAYFAAFRRRGAVPVYRGGVLASWIIGAPLALLVLLPVPVSWVRLTILRGISISTVWSALVAVVRVGLVDMWWNYFPEVVVCEAEILGASALAWLSQRLDVPHRSFLTALFLVAPLLIGLHALEVLTVTLAGEFFFSAGINVPSLVEWSLQAITVVGGGIGLWVALRVGLEARRGLSVAVALSFLLLSVGLEYVVEPRGREFLWEIHFG